MPRRLLLPLIALALAAPPASADETGWRWPTSGGASDLIRPFQAPITRYGTGHRGIDLQATVGQPIFSLAAGTVLFSGLVARTPTLVLDHGGGLRSTYQPITTTLKVGDLVKTGEVLGVVGVGSHCLHRVCLHFGVKNASGYLDPLKLLRRTSPVLLPLPH